MSSTTRIQFSDCFLYLYTSLINDDCNRYQIQEKRKRESSSAIVEGLCCIWLCNVGSYGYMPTLPQRFRTNTADFISWYHSVVPEKYEKSIFWQDKREGTKRSCPFCSGQLGPGLNGQECLFIIILSTLTVHQVRGGDRGTRLNSQSGTSWWGLDFGCVPSGCLSWGLTWHVGSQNYTLWQSLPV